MTAVVADEQLFVILHVFFDFVAKRAKIMKNLAPVFTEQQAYMEIYLQIHELC